MLIGSFFGTMGVEPSTQLDLPNAPHTDRPKLCSIERVPGFESSNLLRFREKAPNFGAHVRTASSDLVGFEWSGVGQAGCPDCPGNLRLP